MGKRKIGGEETIVAVFVGGGGSGVEAKNQGHKGRKPSVGTRPLFPGGWGGKEINTFEGEYG